MSQPVEKTRKLCLLWQRVGALILCLGFALEVVAMVFVRQGSTRLALTYLGAATGIAGLGMAGYGGLMEWLRGWKGRTGDHG